MKVLKLLSISLLILFGFGILTVQAQSQIGADIDGQLALDRSGWSVSMPDANTVAVGEPYYPPSTGRGRVRVYTWNGTSWSIKGSSIFGEAPSDRSGVAISMPDTNTVAIGADLNDGNGNRSGHVRVYAWIGNRWAQKGRDIDGEGSDDLSGTSVSMPDANTVAIGARWNSWVGSRAGHVRIFKWSGTAWVQKGLDIDGEAAFDRCGFSVSMPDSNTVAVGAHENDGNGSNSGHVRIYKWNGSAWIQKGNDLDGEAAGDLSGCAVSMSDSNTVAIGAQHNDGTGADAGQVRVYRWNGNTWMKKGNDIDGEAIDDISGFAVSMADSNTVAIGAPNNNGSGADAGHVRVYQWNGSAWAKKGMDLDGEAAFDYSGRAVSMPDNNTIAIGAPSNDGLANSAGHVRVYTLCPATSSTDLRTACDSFNWIDGKTYKRSNNTATFKTTNTAGCDSIITLNLTINSPATSVDAITTCGSHTWIDGITYTSSNNTATHRLTGAASNGCDSIVMLDLTINMARSGTDSVKACNSFTWIDGNTYTSSNNTAMHRLAGMAANGCDSIVSLKLTINKTSSGTDSVTACNSYTWIDGRTYTTSNTTAMHTLAGMAANGCDSIVTLKLTINKSSSSTDTLVACNSLTWIDGKTYTSSNNSASHVLSGGAANGCDSIINLDLTINKSGSGTDVITACNAYTWIDGINYTSSNNSATQIIVAGSANGCDSTVRLDLTINRVSDLTTTLVSKTITANNASATYSWLSCDSLYKAIPGAKARTFSPIANGRYAVELTENGCVDTSACVNVQGIGFSEVSIHEGVQVYPNPSEGRFNIQFNDIKEEISLSVYSIDGRLVHQSSHKHLISQRLIIDHMVAGIYLLKIKGSVNQNMRLVVVKN